MKTGGLTSLLLVLALTGCDAASATPGAFLFSELPASEYDEAEFVEAISQRPALSEAQEALIQQITSDPSAFLARRPPTEVLNEAELVFFAGGRTFELLYFYSDAVDSGVEALRCRKAWLLERAGLQDEALAEARLAVSRSPELAEAYFVLGYVLGQSDEADRMLLVEIRDAYHRAVTLDPSFVGPSNVDASDVLEQVRAIDSTIR